MKACNKKSMAPDERQTRFPANSTTTQEDSMLTMKPIEIDQSGFGFDTQTGETFTLNPTGAFALALFAAGKSFKDVMQAIIAEFDVRPEDSERDLADFVFRLGSLGLAQVQA
jgi:hypothetical protein